MAGGTLASRITGFARTAALAYVLGVSPLAGAYGVASTVPTILLVLVTGGTLSAVLVPLLVREDDLVRRRERAEALGALIITVTGVTTVAAMVLSPLLARLYALGLRGDPTHDDFVRATTLFLVVFAPQVLAYGISVHAVAILQTSGRLGLAGAAPVATNLVAICSVVAYAWIAGGTRDDLARAPTTALLVLAAGTTLGVLATAAMQVAGARRMLPGLRLRVRARRNETTREVLRLGSWTVLYVLANQVGLSVVLVVATSLGDGAGSAAYQWAFALMQLPYAVVAVSVLSALYPRISRAWGSEAFGALVARGLRVLLVLLVPAALGLVVLAEPVTSLLLGYGSVDAGGEELLAAALRGFGLALLPFTVFQLLTRAAYAGGDTRLPALVNVVVNTVNIAGALLAAEMSGDAARRLGALSAAYAASYMVGCTLLGWRLLRRNPGLLFGVTSLLLWLVPVAAGEAVLLVAVFALVRDPGAGVLGLAVQVGMPSVAALAVHAIATWALFRPALR